MSRKKVLVFMGYYLPGFKSGGPVRSLSNMVRHLSGSVDFYIFTRDHDLGDARPYQVLDGSDGWVDVGNAKVCYVGSWLGVARLARALKEISPDLVYFNSFFDSAFSIWPMLCLRMLGVRSRKIIVATRGEFSEAALSIKSRKKTIFIKIVKFLGFYRNVSFHASTFHEEQDIRRVFAKGATVLIASDLPGESSHSVPLNRRLEADVLRIVFLSRISPMKNVDYVFNVLRGVRRRVEFHVYGPVEDLEYWEYCKSLILQLPPNVEIKVLGAVDQAEVLQILEGYDLLFLPSKGENYCHVIAESLSVGTLVLTSDKTPWRDLVTKGLGWDLPLSHPDAFFSAIERFELLAGDMELARRQNVILDYERLTLGSSSIADNRRLFGC